MDSNNMQVLLTKEQILGSLDLKRETVEVPEWGGTILVRELTAEERDAYEASLMEAKKVGKRVEFQPNLKNVKAKMAAKCIIDHAGTRVFTDLEAVALGRKSGAALSNICDVIERLSGLDKKSKEELEGNLEVGQIGSSPSA